MDPLLPSACGAWARQEYASLSKLNTSTHLYLFMRVKCMLGERRSSLVHCGGMVRES